MNKQRRKTIKKVRVTSEWFRKEIIRNETGKIRETREFWYEVLKDHDFVCEFESELRIRETNELYGLRLSLKDKRLYRGKLYLTVTPGNYEILD